MSWLQSQAFNLVLPILLGPIVFAIVQGLKAMSQWIDALPAWQKRVLVPAIAILVTAGTSALGGGVACDPSVPNITDCLDQFSPDATKALLGSVVAYLLHYLKTRPTGK